MSALCLEPIFQKRTEMQVERTIKSKQVWPNQIEANGGCKWRERQF